MIVDRILLHGTPIWCEEDVLPALGSQHRLLLFLDAVDNVYDARMGWTDELR